MVRMTIDRTSIPDSDNAHANRLTAPTPAARSLGMRLIACASATLLALFCLTLPFGNALGAEDGESAAASEYDEAIDDDQSDTTENSDSASSKSAKSKKETAEEKERREKEEAAEKKRNEADEIFSHMDEMGASLDAARAEQAEAEQERDAAIAERDETEKRLKEERARLETIESELADYSVGMYKQGGVAPYLDVLLRTTSYEEFVNTWNYFTSIYERSGELAAERRAVKEQVETEFEACEERVSRAERRAILADTKCKQLTATRYALAVQAWNTEAEAAEILDDAEEAGHARNEADSAQRALDEAIAQGLGGENVQTGNGILNHPCPNSTVSSGFGYRDFDNSVHKGIDMAAPEGTPYYAAESGVVIAATNGGGDNGGAGNWIVIDHGDGLVTKYMHSLITFVSEGDHVARGQNIGLVGSTGRSTGPHLHFQVEAYGTAIDPTPFL